jgi:predicted nuclease of predicted toxin-antitoxin system
VIDMNLSPEWVGVLASENLTAVHWSEVGSARAPDTEIMARARQEGWVALTQDIDFSQLLFATAAGGPSTVLLRLRDELDEGQRKRVTALILQGREALEAGALLVIDEGKARLRPLPMLP